MAQTMLTAARDVDPAELAVWIRQQYDLRLSAPTFLPVGEESFAYFARGDGGRRYFIRLVEDAGQRNGLEAAYGAVEALGETEELAAFVAPRRTLEDRFLFRHRGYLVALFPFIEGGSLRGSATPGDRARVAEIVASMHGTDLPSAVLPREGLENPFDAPIRRSLALVDSPMPDSNRYQRRLRDLLTTHRNNLEDTIRKVEEFRTREEELIGDWVLTHGEPHLDNFVKDPSGALHLTDCGDLAYGPRERDLFAFEGPDFETYLNAYMGRAPAAVLEPRLFEFYFYRWALQEIADYSTRILFREMGTMEDEHSWSELQDYLPTRDGEIARAMEDVRDVLGRISQP